MDRVAQYRGRGALSNPTGRFEAQQVEAYDDAWTREEDLPGRPRTRVRPDPTKAIISRNDSPDIPFRQSINPYKGCEHGCVYCFARPYHAYWGLSPGLDFETQLFAKADAPKLLRAAFARPSYRPEPIALGTATDPYQPIERQHRITRALLEVLLEHRHPVGIVTKGALVLRDLDLLAALARYRLVHVYLSVTTLDAELAAAMEPRATTPARRLQALARLSAAGVPTGVLFSPVIPGLNDHELERVFAAAADAGAKGAGALLLRLPHELKDLFNAWLSAHYPLRRQRVLERLRDCHGGELYRARFGERMRGTGPYADMLQHRYRQALRRFGLSERRYDFDTSAFVPPPRGGRPGQLPLFVGS
ncbi:MAG: PA0069 family radical SAM protein [Myxococcota bacterium]